MIKYLKSILCSERINRLQLDVDLSNTQDIRRAMNTLIKFIPDDERVFPAERLSRIWQPKQSDEPSLIIFKEDLPEEITRRQHSKLFQVLDYLHDHPDDLEELSSRKLEALTGVSKTYCGIVLTNWKEQGLDQAFAKYKAEHEPEL